MTIPINENTTTIMFQWDNLPDYNKEQLLIIYKEFTTDTKQINIGSDLSTYKNRFGLYPAPAEVLSLSAGQYTYMVINVGDDVPSIIDEGYTNTPLTKGLLIVSGVEPEVSEFNSPTTYKEYEG